MIINDDDIPTTISPAIKNKKKKISQEIQILIKYRKNHRNIKKKKKFEKVFMHFLLGNANAIVFVKAVNLKKNNGVNFNQLDWIYIK